MAYGEQKLLEDIQRERNPTMAELEREHAIDVVRNAKKAKYQQFQETARETVVRLTMRGRR
jgi:hypothetical protein